MLRAGLSRKRATSKAKIASAFLKFWLRESKVPQKCTESTAWREKTGISSVVGLSKSPDERKTGGFRKSACSREGDFLKAAACQLLAKTPKSSKNLLLILICGNRPRR